MLCTFAFQAYATHVLTPAEYGVLARWLTDLNYFGLFLVFGLDNAILYYSKDPKSYSENIVRNLSVFVGIGLILVLGAFIGGWLTGYVLCLIVSMVLFASYQSMNAYNQLNEMHTRYGGFVLLRPLLLLIALIGLSVSSAGGLTANQVITSYCFVGLALVLVVGWATLIRSGIRWPKAVVKKDYVVYGGKSMFNTLLAISLYTSTVYCLDYILGKEAVAYFFVASAVAKLVWVLPDAVGNVMYPRFLRINRHYTRAAVMEDAYRLSRIVVVLNILAVLVFLIAGRWFISFIFGDEFVDGAYPVIAILLIGNQGMVLYKILGRYLASMDDWRPMHVALGMSVAANVLLNFWLAPSHGVVGSAIATSIAFWVCGSIVALRVPGSFHGFFSMHKLFKDFR